MMGVLLVLLAATPDAGAGPVILRGNDAGFLVDAGEHVIAHGELDGGLLTPPLVVTPKVVVEIRGAKVLPTEVYLDVLDLPAGARADAQTARLVRTQLLGFLRRTGFELADAEVSLSDAGIEVDLDEGQVERILFPGQLSYQLMRFKLALQLPNDVFNRSLLDRQIAELSRTLELPGVRWELVQTAEVKHVGPQVEKLPAQMDIEVQGEQLVHARRPYEVRVYLPENTLGTSLGIDVRSGYSDGLEAGLNYLWRDLFGEGDRLSVAGSGGVGLRARIDTERVYAHFSRAYAGAAYDSAPLFPGLRLNVRLESTWLARQRTDLGLEDYNALMLDGTVQAELTFRPGLRFLAGSGLEWRRLFGFTPAPGVELPPVVVIGNRLRPFLRVAHESVFDASVKRWDRRHTLESELREYFPAGGAPGLGWADLRYQYVRGLGWHDLWVRSRGRLSWGDVTFHDEVSLGEFTRGLFGTQHVHSAVNLQLEFRFSITRDLLKLSVFHDLAVFAVPSRVDGTVEPALANGFGPGLHFLVQELFQLDMYVAFGFRRGSPLGAAFSMQFQKAF